MIQIAPISISSRIENLKQQLSQTELDRLEYVIIAHSDDRMINQLKQGFVDSSIAVISIPQSCWAMEHPPIDELMDWLVNELNVVRILLVGHSQGGSPAGDVEVCGSGQLDPASDTGSTNRISSILDRVKHAQSYVKQNEQHFLHQLACLKSLPSIEQHILKNQQIVQGLFYRAESGVFCYFDPATRQFRALILEN